MATSGVTTNQIAASTVVESALRKLGALAIDQTPETSQYTTAYIALNAMLGEFRTVGYPLWARTTYTFIPTLATESYSIGTGQTLNTPYPVHILQAYRTDNSTTQVPLEVVPDYNYNLFPAGSSGNPIQLTYRPGINIGTIKLWPTPDASSVANSTITIVYQRPMEYISADANTFDIPEEWVSAIIYGLAVRLAPEYSVPLPDRQQLMKEADKYLQLAIDNGNEDASLFFQPERRA